MAERARPEEKAILARVESASGDLAGGESSAKEKVEVGCGLSSPCGGGFVDRVPRMMQSPTMRLVSWVASSR